MATVEMLVLLTRRAERASRFRGPHLSSSPRLARVMHSTLLPG